MLQYEKRSDEEENSLSAINIVESRWEEAMLYCGFMERDSFVALSNCIY
jgi:hypothetical protein